MKKLLFITPELPYPPQSGGKVKSMKLVQALAERYEVTYVSPLKLEDPQYFDAFAAASPCEEHFVAPLDIPRSAGNLLRSYLNGQPLNVRRSFDGKLAGKVAAMADQFDLIFLDPPSFSNSKRMRSSFDVQRDQGEAPVARVWPGTSARPSVLWRPSRIVSAS